jgi:hypothetical protein
VLCSPFLAAQKFDCEKIVSFLNEKETQIEHLNLQNPDYIPLHYLFSQEIMKELEQFRDEVIPNLKMCSSIIFSDIINKYDKLKNSAQCKHDSLSMLSKNVYLIFYEKALYEYQMSHEADGDYFLQRSLQYFETFPDAILLKLNKLLDKNRFDDCLTLLNTLYYETQLDEKQENKAIEFTDKFYDKLYKTGDSLIKIEHAADALEFFEILEIFCLNLPSTYCNDDYYHGVLRSKSGILESYVTVARTAEKRGHTEIAAHFYQYAKEYLQANPYLENYEYFAKEIDVTDITNITNETNIVNETTITHDASVINETSVINVPDKSASTVALNPKPKEKKVQYDKIVVDALALCVKEKFVESYNMFLEAKKLEECNCFATDFRVDLMLRELTNYLH